MHALKAVFFRAYFMLSTAGLPVYLFPTLFMSLSYRSTTTTFPACSRFIKRGDSPVLGEDESIIFTHNNHPTQSTERSLHHESIENRPSRHRTSPDGPIAKFIVKKGGKGGFQHVAFRVENIEEALAELQEKGVALIDKTPRIGAGGAKIAFLHPKATGGVLVEISERN